MRAADVLELKEETSRLMFKFVLKIFYGTIVVENADLIPPRGTPW